MRKIGELKGKPIIEGNPNEIKKNQIHYKESDGGITLSERKEDNTLSSVTSGSGSGEGVKEYYYKIIGDSTKLSMLTVCTISSIIYLGCKVTNTVSAFINLGQIITTPNDDVTGFSIIGQPSYCIHESEYDLTCNIISSLNFKDKVIEILNKEGASEEESQAIINTIDSVVQEITKEEYESMITYKPE